MRPGSAAGRRLTGLAGLSLGVLVFHAAPARAFITDCHQRITTEALAQSGWPLSASPVPLAGDEALLLEELPIGVAPSARNLWSLSVLLGNLYIDVGSNDPLDVTALAQLAAAPDLQQTHCLRAHDDDGDTGSANAVANCRAYILNEIGLALGDADVPDLDATESVRLHLVFRGPADVPLQRYGFHLGAATHALEDGFSHAFRSADEHQVKTLLNWVDWVNGAYDPARDGFQHLYALDQCGPPADASVPYDRADAARAATIALLAAVADDTGGRAGRLARASAVLDDWMGFQAGCTAANNWCDAPERLQTTGPAGCAVAGSPVGPAEAAWLLAAVALLGRRRRRRTGLVLLVLLLGGAQARAADGQQDDDRGEVKGRLITKATPEEQRLLALRRFGVLVKGGFAIDNAGWDVGAGLRYDVWKAVTVGADVEVNPWVSFDTSRQVSGATNVYAVGIYRLDVRDYLELRLTLAAGISVLNFDTWAAKAGSVGPYFAVSPLGVAIRMGSHLRFILDPGEIAIPIPQTTGIPLVYRQHRFSTAVQVNF